MDWIICGRSMNPGMACSTRDRSSVVVSLQADCGMPHYRLARLQGNVGGRCPNRCNGIRRIRWPSS